MGGRQGQWLEAEKKEATEMPQIKKEASKTNLHGFVGGVWRKRKKKPK